MTNDVNNLVGELLQDENKKKQTLKDLQCELIKEEKEMEKTIYGVNDYSGELFLFELLEKLRELCDTLKTFLWVNHSATKQLMQAIFFLGRVFGEMQERLDSEMI